MKESKITALTIFSSVIFFTALLVFWGTYYPSHLVQKEQMQLFLTGFDYLTCHLAIQDGFAIYCGEFLTQFFLYPWVGAFVVSGIIFSIYYPAQCVLKQLFGNRLNVLAFLPAVGYCFLLCNDFFYISGALAVGVSIWTIVIYLRIAAPNLRMVFGLILIPLIYWLFGGTYILFVLSVISIELVIRFKKDSQISQMPHIWWFISGCLLMGISIPLVVRHYLVIDTLLQCYYSSAYYKFSLIFPSTIILIFLSVPFLILYQFIVQNTLSAKVRTILQYVFGAFLLLYMGYGFQHYPNVEEEKEMLYDNLVNRQQWFDIIKNAEKNPPTGSQGRLALMLAMGQTNQLSTRLFSFNPHLTDFFIPYKLHGMAPLIANEPYFYLGLINFSQMLAMESIDSSPDAVMPVRAVKRYAETCIVTGQYDVAAKFLSYLQKNLFYRKWANDASTYLNNEEKINAHPLWGKLRSSQVKDDFYFQFDQVDLTMIALLRGNPKNRMAYEYLMSSFLLQKDLDQFLKYLPLSRSMNYADTPLVYQEALVYTKTLLPEWPEALAQYKISDDVRRRIELYAGAFKNGGNKNPALMKQLYGNTYWYYVHFNESTSKN
ncbi:MAG: DUF6057 family protein [Bacteroidia bacterium]|nr:DUF6057 family protein [Bacteroidia bacterium]